MKRRTARIVLVLVLLAALVTAGVFVVRDNDDRSSNSKAASPVITASTAPSPTTVPQEAPFAALATVVPETLDGYEIDTGAKATGSLNMDAAVAAESDQSAERALLETRSFEAGYGRAFTNGETDVYMTVYDFETADDARLYAADGIINLTGKGASIYDVPEIAGAQGFSQATNADSRPAVVHGVVFSKNDRFVLIFTRSSSTASPSQAKDLAVLVHAKA
jgi:hypothetical protein